MRAEVCASFQVLTIAQFKASIVAAGGAVHLHAMRTDRTKLVAEDGARHLWPCITRLAKHAIIVKALWLQVVQYICGHAALAAVACAAPVLPILLQTLPDCPSVKLVVRPALYWFT